MNKDEILELDNSRFELENRIQNLLWTVSGDYGLEIRPDVSLFLRSESIALYDGIKQGAFARYYDKECMGLYLVKKVFLQADEGALTLLAQLCIEEAVGERICIERPGVKSMQRQAFEDILEQEFEEMPSPGDYLGRLKAAVLRRRLEGSSYRVEKKLQGFLDLVVSSSETKDTMELIRVIDQLYNSLVDPSFERLHGNLEKVLSVTMKELSDYPWEDFLTEELYEELSGKLCSAAYKPGHRSGGSGGNRRNGRKPPEKTQNYRGVSGSPGKGVYLCGTELWKNISFQTRRKADERSYVQGNTQ